MTENVIYVKYLERVIGTSVGPHHNGPYPKDSAHVLPLLSVQLPPQRVPSTHINTSALRNTMAHKHARFGKWSISIRSAIRIDDFLREPAWRSVCRICTYLMRFERFCRTHVHAASREKSSIRITDLGDAVNHRKRWVCGGNVGREAYASLHCAGRRAR